MLNEVKNNKKKTQSMILLMILSSDVQEVSTTEAKRLKASLNYFIPEVKTINGKKIPSTPFYGKNKQPIFIGDVLEIKFTSEGETSKEINMVTLIDGEYVTICKNEDIITPMNIYNPKSIKVLGNVEQNPELLNLLDN